MVYKVSTLEPLEHQDTPLHLTHSCKRRLGSSRSALAATRGSSKKHAAYQAGQGPEERGTRETGTLARAAERTSAARCRHGSGRGAERRARALRTHRSVRDRVLRGASGRPIESGRGRLRHTRPEVVAVVSCHEDGMGTACAGMRLRSQIRWTGQAGTGEDRMH